MPTCRLTSTPSAEDSLDALGFQDSVVLYCNFRSLAFLGLFGFFIRQLKIQFIATLISAANSSSSPSQAIPRICLCHSQGLGFRVRV